MEELLFFTNLMGPGLVPIVCAHGRQAGGWSGHDGLCGRWGVS